MATYGPGIDQSQHEKLLSHIISQIIDWRPTPARYIYVNFGSRSCLINNLLLNAYSLLLATI